MFTKEKNITNTRMSICTPRNIDAFYLCGPRSIISDICFHDQSTKHTDNGKISTEFLERMKKMDQLYMIFYIHHNCFDGFWTVIERNTWRLSRNNIS